MELSSEKVVTQILSDRSILKYINKPIKTSYEKYDLGSFLDSVKTSEYTGDNKYLFIK